MKLFNLNTASGVIVSDIIATNYSYLEVGKRIPRGWGRASFPMGGGGWCSLENTQLHQACIERAIHGVIKGIYIVMK